MVDDHAITRLSLKAFLEAQPEMTVVGMATNGMEAVELARTTPMDVMLLDVSMPGQNGFDSINRIKAHAPALSVLVLSGHSPEQYGVTMVKKGAAGYVSKQSDPAEIVNAVRQVATGQTYLDETLRSLMLESALGAAPLPHTKLADRHFQVFLRLARGQSNQDIARELFLNVKTISTYRVAVMRRLGVTANSELTYYAVKHGLIE